MRLFLLALFIGLGGVGYYFAHPQGLFCCREQFPLLHKHPPYDAVGMAQQDVPRGAYGVTRPGTADADNFPLPNTIEASTAAECKARGGVPLWNDVEGERYSLTCVPPGTIGETH